MNEDHLRQIIEQIDPEGKIPVSKIEDLVSAIKEMELNPPKDGEERDGLHFSVLESELKAQISTEKDWKKKAQLAAKIISLNLE